MYRLVYFLTALVAGLTGSAYAADGVDQPFINRVPASIRNEKVDFLTFISENDNYGDGSDQNYTNGARLTYFNYGSRPPVVAKMLDKYIPALRMNQTTSTYYSIGQNLYTPRDITQSVPNSADRPYAAFLYASMGLTSLMDNHVDDWETTVGVVGPLALGAPVQKFVHKALDSRDPKGWAYQLKNEPALMLSWQRRWPEAYATDIYHFTFRVTPHAGATLGNVYTYGAGGLTLQLTPTMYKWQSPPLRVRPSIPGSGFFSVPEDKFAWSLFAGVEERAMARNIFLDGNTFRNSPSVDKKYLVTDANAGVSFTYGRTQLSYTMNWRSKEFEGQDDPSVFGAVSLGFRF